MAEEASKKEWQNQGDWQAGFARADRAADSTEHVPALQRCGVIWGCVKNVSENSQFVLDFLRKLVIIYLALGVEEC